VSIIDDMAGGRILSLPAKKNIVGVRDEFIPGLALREPDFTVTDGRPRTVSIRLVRAVLSKA
jgi:hypothetical protein